ncbi:uncharacterized protein LOC130283843 isoform X2 [Hyla sarda]|uniref:uncharacterized protein LOC130283843 isoform X2 n=1 Tax=Hyla sarda TaxID=327740 RepID=UPI0024C26157|nr:uncharacterized protein LOC130283843 isoform X2 [Hyla sarda]
MDVIRRLIFFLVLHHSVSSLEMTGPSVHAARLGSDARVPCLFPVDNPPVDPEHLRVFWNFQDKEILSYNRTVRTTSSRYSLSIGALGDGIANLTISNIHIPDGGMYKCSVTYRSERKDKEVRLDIGAPPQVMITGNTVVMNKENVLTCSITGFYPVDIDVKWFKDGEKLNNIFVGDPWRNPGRTYNVNSTLTITPTEEDRERIFSCRVQHEFLQEPLQKNFHLVYKDRTSAVIIGVCCIIIPIILIAGAVGWKLNQRRKANRLFIIRDIEAPPKLIDGEEATLHCTVDNDPEDLCVTWWIRRSGQEQEIQTSQMRGHSEEEEGLLDTSYVIRSQRDGHQCITSLSFIPHIERHRDVTFICRGVYGQHQKEKTFHCKTVYVKPKLLQPITRSLLDSAEIKYLLSLEKFFPKSIKIVWMCGVERTDGALSSTESPSDNPDRTYNISSEVRIPEDRHKDPAFRVQVTWEHKSMDETEFRELSIRDPDYRWTPVVGDIQIPRLFHGSATTLQCNISEYFPDAVTVKWLLSPEHSAELYEEINTANNQRIISRRESDNTYSYTTSLTITPTRGKHQGAEYICLVDHPSLEKPIERRTGGLQVYAEPQMLVPIEITMPDSFRVQFSLNLQKFYPKDIRVSWHRVNTNGKYQLSAQQTVTTQDGLIYDVTSVLQIYVYKIKDPQMKIIVEWEHETMEIPEIRSLSIRDLPWRPHVGSINVPKLEDETKATITCDISGYFPDLLSIFWFMKKDGNLTALPIESSKTERTYKISHKEKRQKDNTYSCEASLTFTPISSDQGSEIICRVGHPSLEGPIERNTGPLHIG